LQINTTHKGVLVSMFLAQKAYEQDNKIQEAIVRLGQKSGG